MSGEANPEPYEVRRSKIHGHGVFASRAIAEGEYIVEYVGEKITKAESERRGVARFERSQVTGEASVYIFDLNKRYDLDGDVEGNDAKYINHSCDPNAEAQNIRGKIWIVALRDIPKGEEIGFDYGYDVSHFLDHPCRCGSEKCVGYIVSREQWHKLRKMLRKRSSESLGKKKKATRKGTKKKKTASRVR